MAKENTARPVVGCPGCQVQSLHRASELPKEGGDLGKAPPSELANWPLQLALVPVTAPYLQGATLVIAADCVGFAHTDFHRTFLRGENRVCLIGCPKLDETDAYIEKLAQIIRLNGIRTIRTVRMHVPCCGGMVRIVKEAIALSGCQVEHGVTIIDAAGTIIQE